ncbi:DJ-1/PfpI family protein [Bosea sp. LjRoot237]|uniref:DJ-1/PfpI family protein n=1 Tax=Bosea sp. LjRoot237 TaxID=3342292 RepID=UPI003ECFA38D
MFGFLIYPGVEELDLVGPWEMATMWKTYAGGPGCVTVSQTGGPAVCAKGLKIAADHSFADCPKLDYLLVPGGFAALEEAKNPEVVDFVARQAREGEHILSVCTGSFILEAAGLLDGRKATTHWKLLPKMREMAGVEVIEERFVHDGNVWTSAGVSAGIDLTLAFIAAVAGEEKASIVQYNAEYYPDGRIYGTAHRAQHGSAYFRELETA